MEFHKYMHIERFGTDEVEGIEIGRVHVFPKIDGSNGSVWYDSDNGIIEAGSRNRVLTLDNDNQGFYEYILKSDDHNIRTFLYSNPQYILYGEWLIPHSLKTYRADAWRKFYVFDVYNTETHEYMSYDDYEPMLLVYNLDYIIPLGIVYNGVEDTFKSLIDKNTYLLSENSGVGEGIVLKNYDYVNKYGRQTYAKIVTNEFKEKHIKAMGANEIKGKDWIEQKIVDQYCTVEFINKEYAKFVVFKDGWRSEYIPELLGRVWHEFIVEESWNFIKSNKNPVIDFKLLNKLVVNKIKEVKSDAF